MPFYASDIQFYTVMQVLFDRLRQKTPNPVDNLTAARLILRLKITSPDAEILVNGRMNPPKVHFGNSARAMPDLDAEMSGDTLHKILTQELSLKDAWMYHQVKVKGSIFKAAPLADILNEGRVIYPDVLRELNMSG